MTTISIRTFLNLNKRLNLAVPAVKLRFYGSITDQNILKSPYQDVDIPRMTIPELVFSKIGKWRNHIATECPVTGRKYTYDQLQQFSYNLSGFLRKKFKLNKGDVVAILLPNCPEYPIVTLGIIHGGMIATTLNPLYTSEEISRQLMDSGAKVMITFDDFSHVAKAAVTLTRQSLPILTVNAVEGKPIPEGAISLKEVFQTKIALSDMSLANPDDVALMPYSSGTTGLPKGVLLTHSNIVSNFHQSSVPDLDYFLETTSDHQDVIPSILPLFHAYGLILSMLLPIFKGSKNVCVPKFEPQSFVEMLVGFKPVLIYLTPPLVLFMTTHEAVKSDHLASLRNIYCGAAPLGSLDEERFLEKAKRNIVIGQGYGMTEASPMIASSTKNIRGRPGSSGFPIPNTEIKVVDHLDPLRPSLGPNQKGELLVRGPQLMKGYHNKPEETKNTLVNGWLQTGDIVFYDEAGNLVITGRLKELIKVKGFQVAPAELEGVLREYPDVTEAGVIGIPHKRYGEVPRAYVTLKPGVKFNEEKLKEFVKSKLVSYKELKGGIKVIDSIPKNPSGKILRRKLKEYYEEQQT